MDRASLRGIRFAGRRFEHGRTIASMIPNARLIDLDGSDHVILPHAPLVPLGRISCGAGSRRTALCRLIDVAF
jgi:hypothetical protein